MQMRGIKIVALPLLLERFFFVVNFILFKMPAVVLLTENNKKWRVLVNLKKGLGKVLVTTYGDELH